MTREELLKVAKPILFSTPMVQAILEGRKTMTRRICKPLTLNYPERAYDGETPYQWLARWRNDSPHHPGDILYVRETWVKQFDGTGSEIEYRADWKNKDHKSDSMNPYGFELPRWKPSMFMPKAAARIFLRVTDVWVERLRDMPLLDVWSEGTPQMPGNTDPDGAVNQDDFKLLWDSLNAKRGYGWNTNPWVWVYSFERVRADQ